ncbi:MAG: T9SS type A sorting domain-containing protein [Candidatus Latescibacteria bacterium]|nr:T9SS type A sorting domain-containing protein [Candidatus Latescibacterota bacterium]
MRRALPFLLLWAGPALGAMPVFENRTPVGFAPQDSTTTADFIVGDTLSVRVDLNQAATPTYPVIANFHAVEKSDQLSSTDTDGMQVDVAMVDVAPFGLGADQLAPGVTSATLFPTVHVAWIEQAGLSNGSVYNGGITPIYKVMYARSTDGGATFTSAVSVSGSLTYHPLTTNGNGTSFSTLDLEVSSGGQPRVAYAFVSTASHARDKNVFFSYSQDNGLTWQTPIKVNNTATAEGRSCAFPRLAIDDRDNIFIAYVRGTSRGTGSDDIMLAKVNRYTDPFSMEPTGEDGLSGSGGVRLTPNNTDRNTGPDIKVGDGDALHVIYFHDTTDITGDRIEHKRLRSDTSWVNVGSSGWDQTARGALVATFDNESANNAALETNAVYYFPTLAIDRLRLPDRVYAVFKYGTNTPAEGIYFNSYNDVGAVGSSASWGTATAVWNTALFSDDNQKYNIELDWELTERVSALVDDRLENQGDLHIAFSAGYSNTSGISHEHDIYYATYNGVSWTLPEKVADDDSDGSTEDGIASTDVFLLSPALAQHPENDNLFLAFAGGTGEGFGLGNVTNVNHHPYFKVLGRAITWEDESVPVGGYQYTLTYKPVNPQSVTSELTHNPVYVHVANPTDGSGLGASGSSSDGFLSGEWETVGSTLADDDKYFEGLVNDDSTTTNEWGDDDDKIGLLVKLNVLGSDSATNLQVVTNSTASAEGTGKGARTVRVGSSPIVGFLADTYFQLGADIDILPSSNKPTVSISQPDGVNDSANTSFGIIYNLNDADDNLSSSGLKAAFYAYPSNRLRTVQDVRIFGTLVADENDVSTVSASGTNDFLEGTSQTYTWDEPPAALQDSLFASILKVPSGDYYIYLVADDQKNPPVFAVSPGPLTIRHSPVVQQIDPSGADTVDTGVRSGLRANPYDLDFSVVDYDSQARVQLFYASATGITSLSAKGVYPNQNFVLGKSVSGTRGTAITSTTSLTSHDHQYSWDVTSPQIAQGLYYLYAVASDSFSATVGNSSAALVLRHSPSFVFYEPAKDTQRQVFSRSQPVYTIQWQKGPGDQDLDNNASISLYFTTDDPAATDHSTEAGASSTSLTSDADTRLIVSGLSENGDGPSDMYAWNLRSPPNSVPVSGTRVWLYAVIDDGNGNVQVAKGGSLVVTHAPSILLKTRMPEISQGDLIRLEWDDYLVDDGASTDDAYIRLYASTSSGLSSLQALEAANPVILNSSTGTTSGTITAIRESEGNAFNWDTKTSTFALAEGSYAIYAGISADPTFSDNTTGQVSEASNRLVVKTGSGLSPHLSLSPNKVTVGAGDTLTFEVLVQSGGMAAEAISAVVDLQSSVFSVVNSSSPFTDLGVVFSGGSVVENTTSGTKVRFTKTKPGGELVGTAANPARLASFRVVVGNSISGTSAIKFDDDAALNLAGNSVSLKSSTGMSVQNAQVQVVGRGRIEATVLLEGRSSPIGNGNHSTLLDVHLRLPGSTADVVESRFRSANDDLASTTDTVEVQTSSSGALSLYSVPAGRYVLTVKDTSHLSGRTDTIAVRNGEVLILGSSHGFFASDVRGDASFLLGQDGHQLKAGDVTEDNEIDEDDINAIDAAWGTNTSAAYFKSADLNNDLRVSIEDLVVTSSNISNTTGLGAPPVFKPAYLRDNGQAGVEVSAPQFAGEWCQGLVIELVYRAKGLGDLAGYDLELVYDPGEMEVEEEGLEAAGIFRDNPQGYTRRVAPEEGRLGVAAARRGKGWSASGEGELLRVKVKLHRDGYPESLRLREGKFLASSYQSTAIRLLNDPTELALPKNFSLGPNYPNPFNPSTTIPFTVPLGVRGSALVAVEIYDLLGQRVQTLLEEPMKPGYYRAVWDGLDSAGQFLGSGVYFCRVRVGEQVQVRKMALVK